MQNVPKIRVSEAVAYATMPRIIPRCRQLFFSGFNHLSFLVAHIYAMVRLLPAGHPYLDVRNSGRFGVRHVIAEASRNLEFKRENTDQILVFFSIIAGIVLLLLQFVVLLYAVLVPQAHAFSWFDTVTPGPDIAYNILDRVFGVPGVFCSIFVPGNCTAYSLDTNGTAPGAPPLPLPFHQALHILFRFYSMGLLLIATLIFMYFVFVVILETAVTGKPFGNRFQNVWVPVRLIMALGLLMPINYGLNSGQYITLYTAKYASSFATNGWRTFNTQITNHSIFSSGTLPVGAGEINGMLTGEPYTILAIPEVPSIKPLLDAMTIVHSCAYLYTRLHSGTTNRTVRDGTMGAINKADDYTLGMNGAGYYHPVIPFFVKVPTDAMTGTITLANNPGAPVVTGDPNEALGGPLATRERMGLTAGGMRTVNPYHAAYGFYYGSDIILRFGEYGIGSAGEPLYPSETGYVAPLCGEVRIPVLGSRDVGGASATPSRGGEDHMLRFYYDTTLALWFDEERLKRFARHYTTINGDDAAAEARWLCDQPAAFSGANGTDGFPAAANCRNTTVNRQFMEILLADYQNRLLLAVRQAWGNYVRNGTGRNMRTDILERGWGGAGIWYTKIAELNGGFSDAVNAVPYMSLFPDIMEKIRKERQKVEKNPNPQNPFRPYFISSSKTEVAVKIEGEQHQNAIGVPMARVAEYLNSGDLRLQDPATFNTGNFLMDIMNGLLGTTGLSKMRTANFHMHPLAQLSMVGKGLLEASIRNFAVSTGLMFFSPIVKAANQEKASGLMAALANVLTSTSMMALSAGFILFYVMPFLPFLYFFFAVGSWVKSIFEAMVGVPLWALAHLRIDGEGLPGDAASNGYFLLLEIFIRPILTVVGLLAAIIVFSAQVRVLNLIWELAAHNLGGGTTGNDVLGMTYANAPIYSRSTLDQFFLTMIYVIVVYMLGLASFKLVDRIPDNILRWAGAGVSSFGDIEQDNVEGLNRYVSMGTMQIGTQLIDATQSTASKLGQALPEIMSPSGSGTGRGTGRPSGSGTTIV